MQHKKRIAFLIVQVLLIVLAVFAPRVGQRPDYHSFADQNMLWGIPNFQNVVSNIIFLLAGVYGILRISKTRVSGHEQRYLLTFAIGVLLTSFGSAYYHWNPINQTLVWDRLPMTLGFVGFFCWILHAAVSEKWARLSYIPLVLFGIGSIFYWDYTESQGGGDLRPYYLLQFGTMINCLLVLIFFRENAFAKKASWILFLYYFAAKLIEAKDDELFMTTHQMLSGHVAKHLLAGIGCLLFFRYYHLVMSSPKRQTV